MKYSEKLNIGSGPYKKEGYLNVDWLSDFNPDIVHDINNLPLPFEDNSFSLIEAFHVLEHINKPFQVMEEFYRILRPGGCLHVKVPHFSRGLTHAEHQHGFDVTFPFYFDKRYTFSGFRKTYFTLKKMKFRWFAFPDLMLDLGYNRLFIWFLNVVSAIISFVANLSPTFASRIWCFWVGGFDEIEFIFEKADNDR